MMDKKKEPYYYVEIIWTKAEGLSEFNIPYELDQNKSEYAFHFNPEGIETNADYLRAAGHWNAVLVPIVGVI
jgi:hypothetical protein